MKSIMSTYMASSNRFVLQKRKDLYDKLYNFCQLNSGGITATTQIIWILLMFSLQYFIQQFT